MMPRGRKKTVLEVELPDENEGENEGENAAENVEEKENDAILAEANADSPRHPQTTVYQLDADTGDEGWVGKFPTVSVTQEFLAKRFGPGKYRLYMRKPGKTGLVYAGTKTMLVRVDLRPTVMTGAPPSNNNGSGDFSRDLLLSMMKQSQENSQNMVQMMATMMTTITGAFATLKPTADPMMGAVLQAVLNRKDPTEIATSLLGVMKETGGTPKDPIEMLTRLLELQQLLPQSGEQDPTMQWVGKGIDAIRTLAENTRGGARALPAAAPAAVPVAAAPVAPPATLPAAPVAPALPQPEIDPNMRAWKKLVVQNFRLLTSATFMPPNAAALTAKANMEADGVWADLVSDVRADYPALAVDAELPDDFGQAFIARALKDFPMAGVDANTREWMTATLEELAILAVTPEEEAGEDGAAESGDA